MGGHPFHRVAKPNVEPELESRQIHRLAKPRTRTSPTKSSLETLPTESPGLRSPVKVPTKKPSTRAASTRNSEVDHRRDSRLQLRAYLYGSSREVTPEQVSEEEKEGKKSISSAARGVRDRLSRTASMVSRPPSAKVSQSSLVTDAQSSEDESARTAEEIKAKAMTDYFTAMNHISIPLDEDTDPDSVTSPIRRRSLLTPGLATRMPDDILRRPPMPHNNFPSHQNGDCYFNPQLPRHFALPCLASTPTADVTTPTPTPRADTPCDFDHTYLGGFQLGTLRVTNGIATPSTRSPAQSRESSTVVYSKPSSTVVCSKPLQLDHQDMYLISSEAIWREETPSTVFSECPPYIPRCASPDTFEDGRERGGVGELEGIKESADLLDRLGPKVKDHYKEGHEEGPFLEHATRDGPYQHQAPGQVSLLSPSTSNSGSAVYNSTIIYDHMLEAAENTSHSVERVKCTCTPTVISLNTIPNDDVENAYVAKHAQSSGINWRSIADDAELRHTDSGTREDALRILNGDLIITEDPRPLSSSTASSSNDRTRSSWQSTIPVDSGYCSNESITFLAKASTPPTNEDGIMNNPRVSRPGTSRCPSRSREMPQLVPPSLGSQSLLQEPRPGPLNQLDPAMQQHTRSPIQPKECLPVNNLNTKYLDGSISEPSLLKSHKLRKSRPSSQNLLSRSITVGVVRSLDDSNIPPIPSPIFARHAQRLENFRSLEHTFPTLQHTASEDDLSDDYSHVPIRFPSPGHATHTQNYPDTYAVKAKRRKSLFGNDSRPLFSWRHSSVEPAKTRSRSRGRTADHESALQTIADFGTVTESLGGSPYDIARSQSLVRSTIARNESIWHPHQMSTALPRTRTVTSMNEETAADKGRLRSRSRSQSLCRLQPRTSYNEPHENQDCPTNVRRPTSLVFDVPPMPALPTSEQIRQREVELSRSSAEHSTLTPPRKTKKAVGTPVEEHEITETNTEEPRGSGNEGSNLVENTENAVEADRIVENKEDPSWDAYRNAWSQHRKTAGESLLLSRTETPKVSEAPPLRSGMNPLSFDSRPIGGPLNSNPPEPAIPMPKRQAPPITTVHSAQTEPKRRSVGSESPYTSAQHLAVPPSRPSRTPSPSTSPRSTPSPSPVSERKAVPSRSFHVPFPAPQKLAPTINNDSANSSQSFHTANSNQQDATLSSRAERLSGRFDGGLSFGYEPGFGLGGSAGTRSAKSGASRKSVDVSLGFGIDLSDVPIFVAPSKVA